MSQVLEDTTRQRLKGDLRAGIECYATLKVPPQAQPLAALGDAQPSVRREALLALADRQDGYVTIPAAVESLALGDADQQVRGLALLLLLRHPDDITNDALRHFALESGPNRISEAWETLQTIRAGHQGLRQGRASLARIAELTKSLTGKERQAG